MALSTSLSPGPCSPRGSYRPLSGSNIPNRTLPGAWSRCVTTIRHSSCFARVMLCPPGVYTVWIPIVPVLFPAVVTSTLEPILGIMAPRKHLIPNFLFFSRIHGQFLRYNTGYNRASCIPSYRRCIPLVNPKYTFGIHSISTLLPCTVQEGDGVCLYMYVLVYRGARLTTQIHRPTDTHLTRYTHQQVG